MTVYIVGLYENIHILCDFNFRYSKKTSCFDLKCFVNLMGSNFLRAQCYTSVLDCLCYSLPW